MLAVDYLLVLTGDVGLPPGLVKTGASGFVEGCWVVLDCCGGGFWGTIVCTLANREGDSDGVVDCDVSCEWGNLLVSRRPA